MRSFLAAIAFIVVAASSFATGARATPLPIAPTADDIAARSTPTRKVPHRAPAPDPRRVAKPNPLVVGLAAGGVGGGITLLGAIGVAIPVVILLGGPTLPVTVTCAVIGIGLALATPIGAGFGAGATVLGMDPRTTPKDWGGLTQCATSGCCSIGDLVGGTVLGSVCGGGVLPGAAGPSVPGVDQPAPWTALTTMGGLVAGGVVGALLGWSVAGDTKNIGVPIAIGAVSGATLGAAILGGAGGGFAEMLRR